MKNSIDFSVSLLHFRREFAFKSIVLLRFCNSALGPRWGLSANPGHYPPDIIPPDIIPPDKIPPDRISSQIRPDKIPPG